MRTPAAAAAALLALLPLLLTTTLPAAAAAGTPSSSSVGAPPSAPATTWLAPLRRAIAQRLGARAPPERGSARAADEEGAAGPEAAPVSAAGGIHLPPQINVFSSFFNALVRWREDSGRYCEGSDCAPPTRPPRSYRRVEPQQCGGQARVPARVAKVAFLFFLNHASLPEALWARFFKGAPRAQYTLYTHINPMCEALSKPNPRNCSFGAGSLFAESAATDARGEPLAIRTARFSFSLVEVERGLLAAALRNPHNAAFVLLSETSVPLWPFQTMRRAVLLQPAMVGAWRDSSAPIAWLRTIEGQWARPERRKHFRRWAEGKHLRALSYLAGTTAAFQRRVNGASWGKASQWWTLTRREACAIAADWEVASAMDASCFEGGCRASPSYPPHQQRGGMELWAPDEHYVPTALRFHGLGGNGSICLGNHHVHFGARSRDGHAKTFAGERDRVHSGQISGWREQHWTPDPEAYSLNLEATVPSSDLEALVPAASRPPGCDLTRVGTLCKLFLRKLPYWEGDPHYLQLADEWDVDDTSWPCRRFTARRR